MAPVPFVPRCRPQGEVAGDFPRRPLFTILFPQSVIEKAHDDRSSFEIVGRASAVDRGLLRSVIRVARPVR
jgi:hypothetical protein